MKINENLIIPYWLLQRTDLSLTEKLVYAVYYGYTFYGNLGCCKLINEDIYNKLGISERNFFYAKSNLKKLGYIETDGGITVKALVDEYDTI